MQQELVAFVFACVGLMVRTHTLNDGSDSAVSTTCEKIQTNVAPVANVAECSDDFSTRISLLLRLVQQQASGTHLDRKPVIPSGLF
jgi:hypothetical protein